MAQGKFIVSPVNNKTEIDFAISPTADQDDQDIQHDLVFEVETTIEIVRGLYGVNDQRFKNYFDQLLKLSQVGLVGDNAQPELSRRALNQLKIEITNRESGKIKNKYLKVLGCKALYLGIPILLIGVTLIYLNLHNIILRDEDSLHVANMLILWSGSMIGVWLSFAITKTYIEFEDLTILEKDRLEPFLRLIFAGLLSIVFGLLFVKKSIVVNIGDLSSANISTDSVTAFLFGVALGINEKIIGRSLKKKTSDLINSL